MNIKDLMPWIENEEPYHPRQIIVARILQQLENAYIKHGRDRWTPHEAIGILREEFEEAWEAVKSNLTWAELEVEILQVAMCCIRYLETEPRFDVTPSAVITHERPDL